MSANTPIIVRVQQLVECDVWMEAVTQEEAEAEAAALPWVANVLSSRYPEEDENEYD